MRKAHFATAYLVVVLLLMLWVMTAGAQTESTNVEIVETSPVETVVPEPSPTPVYVGTFRVTNYSVRGTMRNGNYTHPGAVAVDPRVIPLGTKLMIEGFGDIIFTAEDTGGGVLGAWIDIFRTSYADARDFGMQFLHVWIVEEK